MSPKSKNYFNSKPNLTLKPEEAGGSERATNATAI